MGRYAPGPGVFEQSHGDYSILDVKPELAQRVHAFLRRPDVADTFQWDSFIEWALYEAESLLADCCDDGDNWCMTHESPMEPYAANAGPQQCDARQGAFG